MSSGRWLVTTPWTAATLGRLRIRQKRRFARLRLRKGDGVFPTLSIDPINAR